MTKDKKDVRSSSNTGGRRVRPDILTRIRTRASGGSGSGSGSGDSGSNPGPAPDEPGTEPASGNLGGDTGIDNGSTGTSDGLRVVGGPTNRSGGTGSTGSGRDISSTGSGEPDDRESGILPADVSVNPSTLRVTEIITGDSDGLIIKGGGGKGKGTRTTTPRKRAAGNIGNDLIFPLKVACGFLFSLPTTFGWGRHWELSDEENDELANNIKNVLDAFPSQTAVDFLKYLDKYMPLIVLGMSLYTMVKRRYKMTVQMQRQQVRAVPPPQRQEPGPQMAEEEPETPGFIGKKLVM